MNRRQLPILAALSVCLLHGIVPRSDAFDPAQQDDSLAVLRHFANVAPGEDEKVFQPQPFSDDQFDLSDGETVTFVGGSEMEELAEAAYFEAHLQRAFAAKRPQVRSIAWSADTVYRQQRPMFFFTAEGDSREGSVPDGRQRIEPGVMIVQFGKMESFDGEEAVSEFEKTAGKLIGELKKISPRIVVVSPSPFFETGPAADLAGERNRILEIYTAALRSISNKQETLFVDLGTGLETGDESLSSNGIHLSEKGKRVASAVLATALWKAGDVKEANAGLLSAIQKKNFLWGQYFRPTNWAFLYGDRQHVPSSRDHKDTDRRWFIEELNQLPGRIAAADSDIWKEAGQ